MNEEATLDEFIGDRERVLSAEPQGVRLALDESYPKEWGFAELEEVCEVNSGFTWNKEQETDSSEDGAVPVIKIGNVQDGYLDLDDILYLTGVSDKDLRDNKARKNWLLMIGSNGSGERVGHCGIIEEDMEFVYASFLYGLHADSEHLLPRFLFYSLNRPKVQQRLTSFTAGSTSLKNLNKSTIENLSIPTPPIPEQHNIATILYTVDKAIEKTEEVINQKDTIKKGVLQHLLQTGIGDHEITEAKLGPKSIEFPSDWEVTTLGNVSTKMRNGFVGTATPHYSDDNDAIPYLQSFNVRENRVDNRDEMVYIEPSFHKNNPKTQLVEGDLLTVQSGHIGTSCVVPPEYDGSNCHALIITRLKEQEANPHFVSQFLNSKIGSDLIKSITVGTTVEHLNVKEFKNMRLPLPSLSEQNQIVEIMSDFDDGIQNEERYLERLKGLKHGLMQDLLSGTVRTTDTNIQVPDEIAQYG